MEKPLEPGDVEGAVEDARVAPEAHHSDRPVGGQGAEAADEAPGPSRRRRRRGRRRPAGVPLDGAAADLALSSETEGTGPGGDVVPGEAVARDDLIPSPEAKAAGPGRTRKRRRRGGPTAAAAVTDPGYGHRPRPAAPSPTQPLPPERLGFGQRPRPATVYAASPVPEPRLPPQAALTPGFGHRPTPADSAAPRPPRGGDRPRDRAASGSPKRPARALVPPPDYAGPFQPNTQWACATRNGAAVVVTKVHHIPTAMAWVRVLADETAKEFAVGIGKLKPLS
jgi:hypothetical protein